MDKFFIIPHTHYDAEVFLTREEYLEVGYKVLIDALNALKSDPDYKYTLDQSAFVEPFLKAYPELEETFVEMVRCGRIEIVGGMYVMSDMNMVSGESIIRQVEFGKGYYKKTFGIDVKTGWMIDTFGHCPQIPQIMKKCGFDHYIFSRVANYHRSEFYWQGIDGSKILTHWMAYHYAVFCDSPGWYDGFREFVLQRYGLLRPYSATGYVAAPEGGDFTYPVRHDTEFARRWNRDPERPFDLVVGTPGEFLAEVGKCKDSLETVSDDMNPVFQGCYSARISVKQINRRMENLLHDAEMWNVLSHNLGGSDAARQIRDAWEPVLFNQVHDIIGGVQMDYVNKNVHKRYHQAEDHAKLALGTSLEDLADRIDTQGEGIPVIVFNSLSWERTDKATVDVAFDTDDAYCMAVADSTGTLAPSQTTVLGRYPNGAIKQARLQFVAKCPAMGYEVYHVLKNRECPRQSPYQTGTWYGMEELNEGVLENERYRLKVDLWKGCITSLVLKETGVELIDPGMPHGNMLVSDEDNGDFWEIGAPLRGGANRPVRRIQPLDPGKAGTVLSIDNGGTSGIQEGAVCSEFAFTQKINQYDFVTRVSLYHGLDRIEIQTDLTNRQKNRRYRIAFPTSIRGGSYRQEIPFGSLERPQGEYPAINWVDYSDASRGLCLLNCGLPGNALVDDKMMLSVMKCTGFVCYGDAGGFNSANSSEGGHEIDVPHHFRYALLPHRGDWREAGLPRRGAEFNHPFVARKAAKHAGALPPAHSFLHVDNPQAIITALISTGDGLLLRIYESTGRPAAHVRVTLSWEPAGAVETDMLGQPIDAACSVHVDGNALCFGLGSYEIKTIRIIQD